MGHCCVAAFRGEALGYDETTFIIPYYDETLARVMSLIDAPEDAHISVLDLGCGTGTLVNMIKRKYRNANVCVVDLAPEMLEMAKKKNAAFQGIQYFNDDIFKIDEFNLPYFDYILSTFVLHNYEETGYYQKIFEKVNKLLAVGGRLIIGDLIECDIANEMAFEQKRLWNLWREHRMSEADVKQWADSLATEDKPKQIGAVVELLSAAGYIGVSAERRRTTAVFCANKAFDIVQLKAELLIQGIQSNSVTQRVFAQQNPRGVQKTGNYGVFFNLADNIQVLVSSQHSANKNSPYVVWEIKNGKLVLSKHDKYVNVKISEMAVPTWYTNQDCKKNNAQFPSYFVFEGGRYLHLAYKACSFSSQQMCKFCSTERRSPDDPNDYTAESICTALKREFDNNTIPEDYHFCLGGGTYLPLSDNVEFFLKIISFIRSQGKQNPIWVEMIPPSNEEIGMLIDAGATSFGFNIEIWDNERREEICPGKSKIASLERYLEAFDYVIERLGTNKIGSCIIVPLDTRENIEKCIDTFVAKGVFPCILPLKAYDGAQIPLDWDRLLLNEREYIWASQYAADKVRDAGIDVSQNEGCLRCPCCTTIHDLL